jgi:hypothetical protein
MFKRLKDRRILHVLSVLLVLSYAFVGKAVFAEEIVISGNGDQSASEVNLSSNSEVTVDQSNEADIQNNVNLDSNTGANTASSNTGDSVDITTGGSDTQLNIENSANSSVVDSECCGEETSVNISNNGSASENQVNVDSSSTTNVSVNQTAHVSNNITGYANTGGNSADSNNGNVSISSGNIKVAGGVVNGPINLSSIKVPQGSDGANINVSGNGDNSHNYVLLSLNNHNQVETNFEANILNNLVWNLNTGGNHADSNNGDVSITTGDILFDFFIKNGPINIGGVEISCCVYDPGDKDEPGNGGDEDGDGGEDENGQDEDGEDGDGDDGEILAEAASTGGLQILGLSDTSSPEARALFFWLGLIFMAAGVSVLGKEFDKNKASFFIKRITLR